MVEKMGMERSAAAAAEADLVIMVVDGRAGWTDGDGAMFKTLWGSGRGSASCKVRGEALLVINKVDLAQGGETKVPLPAVPLDTFGGRVIRTSAKTRDGLDALDAAVLELAGAPQLAGGGMSWCINERQADALIRAHEALMRAGESVAAGLPFDFWTIDLRSAVLALGEVSGEEVTEEILNSIFSRFCLGK